MCVFTDWIIIFYVIIMFTIVSRIKLKTIQIIIYLLMPQVNCFS
jgi:hypothetical protein